MLGRRRRVKKTRLQHGGSLTVADAKDIQSQRDATAQVHEETRQSSGRKPRTESGQRRCGVCGNTGHNVRTCQVDVERSDEEDSK
ncbi:hypothetical protein LY76DRAFT_525881 [Colletotrichum caudatum]|nr:hypothetical protein LY76DRAFT_525881 [Colletotrichum caudatum]